MTLTSCECPGLPYLPFFLTVSPELEEVESAVFRCCEPEAGRDREQLRARAELVPAAAGPRVVTGVCATLSAYDEVWRRGVESQLRAPPVRDSMASVTADNLKIGMETRTSYHSFYRP